MKKIYIIPGVCNFILGWLIGKFIFSLFLLLSMSSVRPKEYWYSDAYGLLYVIYIHMFVFFGVYLTMNIFIYRYIKKNKDIQFSEYIKYILAINFLSAIFGILI